MTKFQALAYLVVFQYFRYRIYKKSLGRRYINCKMMYRDTLNQLFDGTDSSHSFSFLVLLET